MALGRVGPNRCVPHHTHMSGSPCTLDIVRRDLVYVPTGYSVAAYVEAPHYIGIFFFFGF